MKPLRMHRGAVLLALAATLCAALPAAADARKPARVDGRYIVVYQDSVDSVNRATDARERRDGFRSRLRYGHAIKGFAAALTPAQVRDLEADPAVAHVVPDRPVRAYGSVPLATGDAAPPGIRRIESATGTTARQPSSANVAVIDTGVDLGHPDLDAVSGKNCVTDGAPAQDDNGHGTHVAGTIAAENDGAGVVGVAPGTTVYAVKVLDGAGNGTQSQVICGINWVTANAQALNIKVANMSLGGSGAPLTACPGTTDPEHKAICESTAAGVTYAVAAGNSGWDYDYGPAPDTPAVYPEVLTVTATTDSDGSGGGTGGAPACDTRQADDRYASFSNYATTSAAQAHTVAAPGVCIRSTWPGGGHDTISGTSMATPHMAGAVALCLGEAGAAGPCAGLTPAQIVQKMRSDAQQRTQVQSAYGFGGDPTRPLSGRYYGYLGWAGTAMPAPAARVDVSAAPSAASIQSGGYRSGAVADLATADGAYLRFNSTTSSTRTTAWYGTFRSVPSSLGNLRVTYQGSNSRSCSQTLALYRFTDGVWVTLDSRSVGTSEVRLAEVRAAGTLSSYVSSTGDLRVRVRCTTTAGSFYASANQLRIAYDRPAS